MGWTPEAHRSRRTIAALAALIAACVPTDNEPPPQRHEVSREPLEALADPVGTLLRWALSAPMAMMGCAAHQGRSPRPGLVLRGQAVYYSDSLAGRPTASGEPYRPTGLTAAHRDLPFGTRVRVTNQRNGRSVVVRINDRGPFGRRERVIDLSRRAAERLGMIRAGVVPVEIEVVSVPGGEP